MQLSIIIVNFNTSELLIDCLKSLYENYAFEFKNNLYEIIVVDNASSEDPKTNLKRQFPQLTFFRNESNIGFSKANNIGIQKATGKSILLLNPDTVVPAKTLPFLMSYLEKNPTVGIATCKVLLTNGSIDDASHRGFPTPWRALCHFSGLARLFPKSTFFNGYHLGYQNMDSSHEIDACAGAFLLIRASVGKQVNWLDEDYFWYGEDLDLCFKVKKAGFTVMFVPQVSITHYKGAASGIKKHSQHLSQIDTETKRKITAARFDVMRIFYKKHYQNKYSHLLKQIVFVGITLKQKLTEFSL